MARLPQVGGDNGNWGAILNEYLNVSLDDDGALRADSVGATQLKPSSVSTAAIVSGSITENKLDISNNPTSGNILSWNGSNLIWESPATALVTSVGGKTGAVNLVKSDVGLANVDNTSDANKPISSATQTALDAKAATNDSRLSDMRTPTDNSVSTAKVQDEAITQAKLASALVTRFADAQTAATNAGNSASSAASSATTASDAATAANTSAGDAATSATNASTSAASAGTARTAAESARDETIVAVDGQSSWTGAVTLTAAQSKSKYVRRLLTGNTTVTLAAGESAKAYSCTLELQQDATGSRTIILANVATAYGVALPLSTAANNVDIIRLEWNGTRWAGFVAGPQMSIPTAWAV